MSTFKEIFHDALPIIEKAAPTIGGIIGGPAGIATTFIISLLAKTFDAHPEDIKHIANCITCDPDAEAKLKKLEIVNQDLLASIRREKEKEQKKEIEKPNNIEIHINMK